MADLSPEDQQKQIAYRDARFTDKYNDIWQTVGKCVFCDLRDKYIIFEENGVALIITLYAYTDGHAMIVPRRHVLTAKELTQQEWETMRKFMYIAKRIMRKKHGVRGVQFVQKDGSDAQSTVGHYHFHCIPFGNTELSSWNYQKLQNTPLENVAVYKKSRKKIIETAAKFDKKYHQPIALPIICDALIINNRDELLLEERISSNQLTGNYLTPPGGVVDDFSKSFAEEVAREILEETGLKVAPDDLQLLHSQIGNISRVRYSEHLHVKYNQQDQFVWNTFVLHGVDSKVKLKAGDDAAKLLWLPLSKAMDHPQVSPGIRDLIARATHG